MSEYLIEESVLKASLDHVPETLWGLFEDEGPIVRKRGMPIARLGMSFVVFDFDNFTVMLPAAIVSKIEGYDE